MILAATCTSCASATRLLVPHLLVALAPPAADDQTLGTVAWICQACADLSIHSIDQTALLALAAGGAELIGGRLAPSQPVRSNPPDSSPESPKEPTS